MGSLRPGPRDAGDVQLGGSHASWGGECVLGGLVCYDYGLDDGSVQNVAAALFVGLVVAWAVAIFASYASRRGARSDMGYYFSAGCLLGLVCVQWYYVFLAANHAPPSIMPAHTRRHDCLRSRKGGKRSSVDKLNPGGVQGLDVNPCFCHPYARCFDPLTGYVYHEASTADTIVENSNIQCPTDGSARCEEADGNLVPIHTQTTLRPTDRDCRHGRGAHCTEKDPCTPCEAETAALDPHAGYCMFCTADDRGKCHFKQGVGPYCKDGDGGARPLFLASDDLDAALKLVRSLQHANPGWQARPVVTQRDLLEDDGSGGRAWPDVLPGEDDVAFMRPLVVDAILLTQASRFVETNSFTKLHAGSTFGLHVATLRKCAATPGLNDCSDADVRDGVRWTQRWHAAELRKRGAALSQDPLP